jgi:hypothetical protein
MGVLYVILVRGWMREKLLHKNLPNFQVVDPPKSKTVLVLVVGTVQVSTNHYLLE